MCVAVRATALCLCSGLIDRARTAVLLGQCYVRRSHPVKGGLPRRSTALEVVMQASRTWTGSAVNWCLLGLLGLCLTIPARTGMDLHKCAPTMAVSALEPRGSCRML